jgi:iron complex outermembrane receptor protein
MTRTDVVRLAGLWVAFALVLHGADAHADARREAKRHFQKGMALIRKGQTDAGVMELEEAWRIKPHPNVLFNIARAYETADRMEDAMAAWRRYLEARPDDHEAAVHLEALLQVQQPAPAEPETGAIPPLPEGDGVEGQHAQHLLLKAAEAWEARAAELEASTPRKGPERQPELAAPPAAAAPPLATGSESGDTEVYERTVAGASRTSKSAVFAPASVTVLTDEDIRAAGARTLPDVLRRVAGVDVVSMSASDHNVSIRGFNQRLSNRVLVLVNGRSVYQDFLGATLWSGLPISLDDIERIEVIRGPGAALYGANAVVGVINIVTRQPGEGPSVQGRAVLGWPQSADVSVRGQARRGPLGLAGSTGYARTRKWSLELNLAREDRVPGFAHIPYDLSGEQIKANLSSTLQAASWLVVNAHLGLVRDVQEVYAIGALRNFYLDGYLGSAGVEAEAGPARLRVFYHGLRSKVGPQIRAAAARNEVSHVASDVMDAEGTFTWTMRLLGEHRAIVGASYRLKSVTWDLLSGPQLEHHGGVFGENTWVGPGGHRLVVSGRMDRHPLVGLVPAARGAFMLRAGRAAALRAGLGTAFRNPTFLENYLHATPATPVAGASIRSLGSTELRPEQNIMAEVGYSAELGDSMTVDLATYYGRLRGLIVQGALNPPADGSNYDAASSSFIAGESRFINDQETFSQLGGEAAITMNPLTGVDLYANYAFLHVVSEDTGIRLQQTPRHKVNLGGRAESSMGPYASADLHFVSSAVWAERTFDPSVTGGIRIDRLTVPPYALLEARVGWRMRRQHVDLYLATDNALGILPDRAAEHVGTLPFGKVASQWLWPLSAHREHPFANPSRTRVLLGVAAQM